MTVVRNSDVKSMTLLLFDAYARAYFKPAVTMTVLMHLPRVDVERNGYENDSRFASFLAASVPRVVSLIVNDGYFRDGSITALCN